MQKREHNIDLFRIFATLQVIMLHVLLRGGVLQNLDPGSAKFWCAWILEISSYCAVNCFALISGYVMVDKSVKARNVVNLWFQLLFYSLSLSFAFFILVPETKNLENVISAFFPVISNQWWYTSSYFALLFFIPLLNAAIKKLTQKQFKKLLVFIFVGICIMDCIVGSLVYSDAFSLNDGYSAVWLIIVYLFGAYIKKYNVKQKIKPLTCLIGFFATIMFMLISKLINRSLSTLIFGKVIYNNILMSYTSITIVLISIFLFLFFLNIKPNLSKNH